MIQRSLGNPKDKAWVAGWDAGVVGKTANVNPYQRKPQRDAFEAGRQASGRSSPDDVRALKARLERQERTLNRTSFGAPEAKRQRNQPSTGNGNRT